MARFEAIIKKDGRDRTILNTLSTFAERPGASVKLSAKHRGLWKIMISKVSGYVLLKYTKFSGFSD